MPTLLSRPVLAFGWPGRSSIMVGRLRAAERYDVSWRTAKGWADRYRAGGPAGMVDRSSTCAGSTGWVRVQIGERLGMPSSTVHAVLVRCRLNRLSHIDRATGEPIRRYEHQRPGDLLHVDVKELGNVPDGAAGAISAGNKESATGSGPRTAPA